MRPHFPAAILGLTFALVPCVASAFELDPALHYSTSGAVINAYDDAGALVATRPFPNSELRGIGIGPDANMYVVRVGQSPRGVVVDTLGTKGQVLVSHSANASIGNASIYGKIAFDPADGAFYVGAPSGILAFGPWSRNSRLLTTTPAYDVDVLPNGELIASDGYRVSRYSRSGALLSQFSTIHDPQGLTGVSNPRFVDVRGVAYSAAENRTYVVMLGYTNFFFRLMAFDGTSNTLVAVTTFEYGGDLHVDDAGYVLVGSFTQAPQWFSPDLKPIGALAGPDAMFVTGFRELFFDPYPARSRR